MSPRSRRLVAPLALGAVTLCAAAYVGLVDPNEPGHYPLCPTKALTGLDCPGCGGLRATHALVSGDLVGALDHNAFVVLVVVPLVVVAWVTWLARCWGEDVPEAVPDTAPMHYAAIGTTTSRSDPPAAPVGAQAATAASPTAWADPRIMWVLLAIGLVFTVVRNIDAVPALQWLGSGLGAS
jgi:hypothetical protein